MRPQCVQTLVLTENPAWRLVGWLLYPLWGAGGYARRLYASFNTAMFACDAHMYALDVPIRPSAQLLPPLALAPSSRRLLAGACGSQIGYTPYEKDVVHNRAYVVPPRLVLYSARWFLAAVGLAAPPPCSCLSSW
jgi:hypothetical protein